MDMLSTDEFEQWVLYGMFLGHLAIDLDTVRVQLEMQWLEQQHEQGRFIAKHEALHMFYQAHYLPSANLINLTGVIHGNNARNHPSGDERGTLQ